MTTPALRTARRALPILAAGLVLLAMLPAAAPAAALQHQWTAENFSLDDVGPVGGANGSLFAVTPGFSADGGGHASSLAYFFDPQMTNTGFQITPPHSDFYPSGSFTVDAWVSTTETSGLREVIDMDECSGTHDPVSVGMPSGPQKCDIGTDGVRNPDDGSISLSTWQLGVKGGRAWAFVRDNDGGGSVNESRGQRLMSPDGWPTVADGAWHRLTLVRDIEAHKLALYQDGITVGEAELSAGASGALTNSDGEVDPVFIGTAKDQSSPIRGFKGLIDDVSFWDGAEYPDKTPPKITGNVLGDQANGWYTSDFVAIQWKISDESAIRSTTGCSRDAIIEVVGDTFGSTFTCTATSAGGTSELSITLKRDATPPVLTCDAANGTRFATGSKGTLSASVTDATSGVSVTSVSKAIDTSTKGPRSLTLSAEDNVGNLGSVACPYTVFTPVIRKAKFPALVTAPSASACVRPRKLTLRLRKLTGSPTVKAEITVKGKVVKTLTGLALQQPIKLSGLPSKGTYAVGVTLTDANGDKRVSTRVYRGCVKVTKKKQR